MDKLFQIGDFIFRLCCPAEVTPPENFMKFEIGWGLPGQRESGQVEESGTVKAPEYTYHIEVSDHLPEPDGKIVARRPDLLVFHRQAEGGGQLLESRLIGVKGRPDPYACYRETSANRAEILLMQDELRDLHIDPLFTSLLALERRLVRKDQMVLHYDWIMAVIALGSAPFMLLMSRFMIRKQRDYSKKVREMSSELMTVEVEAIYNFDTIKSFGIAPHYSKKMRWWQGKFRDISLKYNMFTIKTNILMSVMGTLVQFLAFGYCLFRLWTNDITYGTMTLFLQQRSKLSSAFSNVVSIIPSFLNSSVSAHRIRELVQLPREVHIPESSDMDKYASQGFRVQMEGVDFSYVEGTRVITDSAFEANPGEIVALVGPSGEGKTTMIRLILGLVRPQDGGVSLCAADGTAIEMNAETRHLFAYVPQGNTIISGTIAENMRMVKEDATDEEIIAALKISCAWDFVSKMPDTINSNLGERGRGLSEGQAQRIAIARAVLRDAPVLLLDEATSALDVTTERTVLRNIVKQHPNKTCIVTTHRPSVLNLCQRTYRVMETKVTELGEEESSRMAMDF